MDVEEQHRTVFAADRRQFTRLGDEISIRCFAVGDVDDDRRKSVRMLLTPRLGNLGRLLERGAHRSAPFEYGSNQTGNLTVWSITPPAPSSDFFVLSSMRNGLLANSLIGTRERPLSSPPSAGLQLSSL